MKRSFLLILIASALLLSAAESGRDETRNPRSQQHKRAAAENSTDAQQRSQEPTIPLSLFQSALSETFHTIRTQVEAATQHARPEKDNWDKAAVIADYLLFLVGTLYTYFAWGQWRAIDKQAQTAQKTLDAIKNQADIAKGTLLAMARPKLVVRYVRNHICEPEKAIEIGYTVVNVGGWPAYVLESNFAICDCLPPMPPYKDAGVLGNAKIPPGAWNNGHYVSKEVLSRDRFDLLYKGSNIYFFGYILYTDEGDGARRYTVICRRWNPLELTLGAFTPIASQDYENAD